MKLQEHLAIQCLATPMLICLSCSFILSDILGSGSMDVLENSSVYNTGIDSSSLLYCTNCGLALS